MRDASFVIHACNGTIIDYPKDIKISRYHHGDLSKIYHFQLIQAVTYRIWRRLFPSPSSLITFRLIDDDDCGIQVTR